MEKETKYTIEEELAIALKKVTGKISDTDFKGTYGLNEKEMELIHEFYDLVLIGEEQ